MALLAKLPQTATLWTRDGTTDRYGNQGYGTPSTFSVRWLVQENIIRDSGGEEAIAKNKVHLASAVDEGDWLALGDQTGSADPTSVTGAIKVKWIEHIPSVNGDTTLYIAMG